MNVKTPNRPVPSRSYESGQSTYNVHKRGDLLGSTGESLQTGGVSERDEYQKVEGSEEKRTPPSKNPREKELYQRGRSGQTSPSRYLRWTPILISVSVYSFPVALTGPNIVGRTLCWRCLRFGYGQYVTVVGVPGRL